MSLFTEEDEACLKYYAELDKKLEKETVKLSATAYFKSVAKKQNVVAVQATLLAKLMQKSMNKADGKLTPIIINNALNKANPWWEYDYSRNELQKEALHLLMISWEYGKELSFFFALNKAEVEKARKEAQEMDYPCLNVVRRSFERKKVSFLKKVREKVLGR